MRAPCGPQPPQGFELHSALLVCLVAVFAVGVAAEVIPHYSCTAVDDMAEHECLLAFEEQARVQRCKQRADERDQICNQMQSKPACEAATREHQERCEQDRESFRWLGGKEVDDEHLALIRETFDSAGSKKSTKPGGTLLLQTSAGTGFDAGTLEVMSSNVNTCRDGCSRISSIADCQRAAGNLSLTWKTAKTAASYPAGCYEHNQADVYFNQDATGAARSSSTPICQCTPPPHGYTTWRGCASPGSICTSACQSSSPPSDEPLGFPGSISTWCYTDTDTGRASSVRTWGECGGCQPGKYKPIGSSTCSGSCNHNCATCVETSATQTTHPTERYPGNNEFSCTSCPSGIYLVRGSDDHVDHLIGQCGSGGTGHRVECAPRTVLQGGSSAASLCRKSGTLEFPVKHAMFYRSSDPNCGNWWAVRCSMEKNVRCSPVSSSTSSTCKVTKRAQCLEVCQGYLTETGPCNFQAPNMHGEGPEQVTAAFSRSGKKCYAGCTDPRRSDGKIKADGFYSDKNTDGQLISPDQWCTEQASGY